MLFSELVGTEKQEICVLGNFSVHVECYTHIVKIPNKKHKTRDVWRSYAFFDVIYPKNTQPKDPLIIKNKKI